MQMRFAGIAGISAYAQDGFSQDMEPQGGAERKATSDTKSDSEPPAQILILRRESRWMLHTSAEDKQSERNIRFPFAGQANIARHRSTAYKTAYKQLVRTGHNGS
jgi:hypothetical protein